MTTLESEFREIRRVATPWFLVNTPDYRAAIATMSAVRVKKEPEPPLVCWDFARGHYALNEPGRDAVKKIGEVETVAAPALAITGALSMPRNSVFFVVVPKQDILEDAAVTQAIANVRDVFKGDRRTLVILGRDLVLPALVKEDVPIFTEPLPTDEDIRSVASSVYESAKKGLKGEMFEFANGDVARAVDLLRGMTRFAVEEGVARRLKKTGLDFEGLSDMQREVVESSTERSLMFDRANLTFDDVGGQKNLKSFMEMYFAGPRRPRLVVRMDEIEKSINASASGPIADNTGVSQDMLRTLLTCMEDRRWAGAIFLGGPGTGKTLATQCVGGTFKVRTLVGDLGACKASLVGESEKRIRRMMDVIYSLGGDRVLICGTCNKLGVMPPELIRRFSLGIWFFDVPTRVAKDRIWQIQCAKFGVDPSQERPYDEVWVGSDIRNCVETAWTLGCSLKTAATYITVSGKVSLPDIERLRDMAEKSGFLCANKPGAYRRGDEPTECDRAAAIIEE